MTDDEYQGLVSETALVAAAITVAGVLVGLSVGVAIGAAVLKKAGVL